jgi:hypothetical protein
VYGAYNTQSFLDPPANYHDEIFCQLRPTAHGRVVENYWSPGVSGYGDHAGYPGVENYIVRGTTPVVGIVDLSLSNHVYVMRWYYETIRSPQMRCGFQHSVLLPYCGAGGAGPRQGGNDGEGGQLLPEAADSSEAPAPQEASVPEMAATSAGSRRR